MYNQYNIVFFIKLDSFTN